MFFLCFLLNIVEYYVLSVFLVEYCRTKTNFLNIPLEVGTNENSVPFVSDTHCRNKNQHTFVFQTA